MLLTAFICNSLSATAAQVTSAIERQITQQKAYPLQIDAVPLENSETNETQLKFTLKSEFDQYEHFAIDLYHYETGEQLLSQKYHKTLIADFDPIEENQSYPISTKLYDNEVIRKYSGSLTVSNGEVNINFEELKSGINLPVISEINGEITDEKYEKIFDRLDIPSFIDENSAKELKHIQRLETYDENDSIIGYRNLDGTNTVYYFSSPVRYKDDNGFMRDAEPNITASEGIEKENGYSHFNDYGKLKTYFAKSLSNNKGVKIKNNGIEFEFGFIIKDENKKGLKKAASAVSDIFSKSNKAQVIADEKNEKVKYSKAVSEESNVIAEPATNGAVQKLILKSVPENNKISFWLKSDDITSISDENGKAVNFTDAGGNTYSIGNIEAKDSYFGENSSGALHFSENNTVDIISSDNNNTLVEVNIDNELLTSPATVYPIEISLSAVSTNSGLAGPNIQSGYFEDRMVYSDGTQVSPSSPYLIVGDESYEKWETYKYYNEYCGKWIEKEELFYYQKFASAYMKYNISSFGDVNPSKICNATLSLHDGSGNSKRALVKFCRVTEGWSENNVTKDCLYDDFYAGNTSTYIEAAGIGITNRIDITRMVTDQFIYERGGNGGIPNNGFVMKSDSVNSRHFCSSEYTTTSYRPQISITYRESYTPQALGLNTETAYWIKNKSLNQYLTVMYNEWKDGSEVGMTKYPASSGSNISSIQHPYMYWQIEYLGDGEYSFIPFNSRNTRLGLESNNNEDYNHIRLRGSDSKTAVWRIVPGKAGGYTLLSKSSYYTKALRNLYSGDTDNRLYALSPEIGKNDWEFIQVSCPGVTSGSASSFAGDHPLIPFKHSNGYTRYSCPCCDMDTRNGKQGFLSPEEQDKTVLSNQDYITVYALQKYYITNLTELQTEKADAIMRVIDRIRSKAISSPQSSNGTYDFRDRNNKFVSNYNYSYDTYKFYIEVETTNLEHHLVNNHIIDLMSNSPGDYGDFYSGLKVLQKVINNTLNGKSFAYSIFEIAGFLSELTISKFMLPNYLDKEKAKNIGDIKSAWGMLSCLNENELSGYNNNYTVIISIVESDSEENFYGDYRYSSKDFIKIQRERLTNDSSGNPNAQNLGLWGSFTYNLFQTTPSNIYYDLISGTRININTP